MASIKSLAPRASLALHSRQLQKRVVSWIPSRSSSTTPPKPRVLEKPERFNPPSHPARLQRKPKYYGPDLSAGEKQAQKTRQYPHMMPPEGTFMHWFLTNRSIHLYISISTLVSLVIAIWYQDFIHNTPFLDLLPPNSMIFSHPITFFRRWGEVYLMHIQHVSRETAERRKQKVDDAQKQKEYRKAHGLDQTGIFDRLAQEEEQPRNMENFQTGTLALGAGGNVVDDASPQAIDPAVTGLDARQTPPRKKLFGIW